MRSATEVIAGWSRGESGSVVHADRVVHVEHVWNTAITVNLVATAGREEEALQAINECRAYFAHVDRTFSTYLATSEATFFRSGLSWRGGHSLEFRAVAGECERLRSLTRGAFDPWAVPGGFDPSGYVKGWAAGQAGAILRAAGFDRHLVNAGGDIWASGDEDDPGHGWTAGIVNPHAPDEIVEAVTLRDCALATSGSYERGAHVVDPRTGQPATRVSSASVIGPDPGMADALASAVLVDGPECMEWFAELGPAWSCHCVIGQTAYTFGSAFSDEP